MLRETVRVLFHLNGYTKVIVEAAERVGLADFGICWDLPTDRIPPELRRIGTRFVVQIKGLSEDEENDPVAIHDVKNRFEIFELDKM